MSQPGSSTPIDSEEGRAFLQERLALFAKVVLALGTLFLVANVVMALVRGASLSAALLAPPDLAHAAAGGVSLAVWLLARRGSYSPRALRLLDAAHLVGALGCYAVMASLGAVFAPPHARADLLITLIVVLVLCTRAIAVPSTPRQTLALGFAVLPTVMVPAWLLSNRLPELGVAMRAELFVNLALWWFSAIAVSTLASRVIYGLRRQVAEAARLGQYLLDEKIGEGGMGTVYRARHALLRRPTAVKLLQSERAGAINVSRFEREVQQTARLTHPNTVAIFDYGRTPEGVFYYAMEFLDGLDLDRLVEIGGPQPPSRVVHILVQVCGALGEAHEMGLVHRDVKPGNIILCERGGVPDVAKVVDFGLVKETSGSDPGLSNVNSIIGTPMFMPPEALLDPETVDARSDIYALGGVAYYLLTATHVFDGALMEVCSKHLHEKPEPPSVRLGSPLPPELEALVLACLEKDREKRPQSARALADALRALDLPAWGEAEARAWWARHAAAGPSAERRRATPVVSGTALTIDIRRRVVGQ